MRSSFFLFSFSFSDNLSCYCPHFLFIYFDEGADVDVIKTLNERLEKEGFIAKVPHAAHPWFVKRFEVVTSQLTTSKYKAYFTGNVSPDSIEALAESQPSLSSLPPKAASPPPPAPTAVVAAIVPQIPVPAAKPAPAKKQAEKPAAAPAKGNDKVTFSLLLLLLLFSSSPTFSLVFV